MGWLTNWAKICDLSCGVLRPLLSLAGAGLPRWWGSGGMLGVLWDGCSSSSGACCWLEDVHGLSCSSSVAANPEAGVQLEAVVKLRACCRSSSPKVLVLPKLCVQG